MCSQSMDICGSRLSGKPFELLPNPAQLRASDECCHERQSAFNSGLVLQVGHDKGQSCRFPATLHRLQGLLERCIKWEGQAAPCRTHQGTNGCTHHSQAASGTVDNRSDGQCDPC